MQLAVNFLVIQMRWEEIMPSQSGMLHSYLEFSILTLGQSLTYAQLLISFLSASYSKVSHLFLYLLWINCK